MSEKQKNLQLSEEQFRRAIEEAPIPTIMQAEDGQVLQISRSWTELTGYKLTDLQPFDNWLTSVVYDYAETVRNYMHQLFRGDLSSLNVEFPLRTANGEVRHWSFSASSPGALLDGRRFIVGMAVDITERKKAEEAFQNAKEQAELERKRLETILEMTPAAVVILQAPDGKFSYANRHARQLYGFDTLGLSLAENVAKVKARRVNGTEYPIAEMPVSRSLRFGEEVRNEEMVIERSDGQAFPILASTAPLYDAQGKIAAAIVVFEDITGRKRLDQNQELLSEVSRELVGLTTISETMDRLGEKIGKYFGVTWCNFSEIAQDLEYSVTSYGWNAPGAASRIGTYRMRDFLSDEQLAKNNAGELTIVSDTQTDSRVSAESYGKLGIRSLIIVPISRDGQWRFLLAIVDSKPRRWYDDEVALMHELAERIWARLERARAEEALKQAQVKLQEYANNLEKLVEERTKQLQEKERLAAIGATAGMVGHDIRNPLQAMISDIYLMKDEIASAPECKAKEGLTESVGSLEENIIYINKIVQDLQDYSRAITPEYSVVDFSKVLGRIFETVKVPESVKLSIKVKNSERLRIDPALLQRALSNLVTNAIQAMPEGGTLEIASYPQESSTVIAVSDTGVGIPDEIKPKLFTPMMTTKSKGQGFGLAVSKRLIEAMKGTICFESQEGKGTKITIELPNTE